MATSDQPTSLFQNLKHAGKLEFSTLQGSWCPVSCRGQYQVTTSAKCFTSHCVVQIIITRLWTFYVKYLHSPFNTVYLKIQCPTVKPPLVVVSNDGNSVVDFQQVAVGEWFWRNFDGSSSCLFFPFLNSFTMVYDLQEKRRSRSWHFRTFPVDLWMYPSPKTMNEQIHIGTLYFLLVLYSCFFIAGVTKILNDKDIL